MTYLWQNPEKPLYVPALPHTLVPSCLEAFHNQLLGGGHLRREATLGKIKERYWWPNLYHDVDKHLEVCVVCHRSKLTTAKGEHPYLYPHA